MTSDQALALSALLSRTDAEELKHVTCQGWGTKMKVYIWSTYDDYDRFDIEYNGDVYRIGRSGLGSLGGDVSRVA